MAELSPTSTRARVLGWLLLIVTAALALNLIAVSEFLHGRASDAVETELEHEALKFRTFADQAVDPRTRQPFTSAADLLESYLREVVPDEQEAMFSVVGARPGHRTRNEVPFRLDRRADVVAAAGAAREPFTASVRTDGGPAVYSVLPVVAGGSPRAALVIVEYTGPGRASVTDTVRLVGAVSAVALVVAGLVAWFVAGRVLAPIRQVRRTADAISESDLSRRIDTAAGPPGDDVAQLAETFNRMLDRLETAFASQREFLDDAAHELRTPLTVIRGHLEVTGDRDDTRTLLLDETARMSRIVDDLLVLAKAQRPDFLTIEDVDLTDLAVSVVAKASPLADRAWTVAEAAEGVLRADGQRLTQALMQLVSNAIRHTGPGDRISVGTRLSAGRALLTVADSGPGVPADARTAIFERFHRGHTDGAGLGLAIVTSIAQAHGGTVSVRDSPLGGAEFVLDLPATREVTG